MTTQIHYDKTMDMMKNDEKQKVVLWQLLVPRNADLEHHKLWDRKVSEIAGGVTVLGRAKGRWVDGVNKMVSEQMICTRIACTRSQFERVIDFTKKNIITNMLSWPIAYQMR